MSMEVSLQNIFNQRFEEYKKQHGMSLDQHRAAQSIMSCQTDALVSALELPKMPRCTGSRLAG